MALLVLFTEPYCATFSGMDDVVVLHLPLKADAELRAVDALDRLLARHRVESRAAGQARFALVEACLNAIEYGTDEVDVRLAIYRGELRMTVHNPGTAPAPKPEPRTDRRGHGLRIIHSFMDRVRFHSDAGGTRVEMTKRVA
jgi:anti-sigma regulatory factor (Ser/Thr protein kinase)